MVLPLSGMGSWAVVVSGALMSLHVLGINLAPLLTVGTAFRTSLSPTRQVPARQLPLSHTSVHVQGMSGVSALPNSETSEQLYG